MKTYLFLLFTLSFSTIQSQSYRGIIETFDKKQPVKLEIKKDGILISFPWSEKILDYNVSSFKRDNIQGVIRFDAISITDTLKFNINILKENSILAGTYYSKGVERRVVLYKCVSTSLEVGSKIVGSYQFKSGLVFKVWDRYNMVRIHSPVSQTISRLYQINENEFISGVGEVYRFSDADACGMFRKIQQLEALEGGEKSSGLVLERFVPYELVRTSVKTFDAISLNGIFFEPQGQGPFPACVLLMGGGDAGRENYLLEAEAFASHGIAVLLLDKRGTGESEGELNQSSFQDLTKDAICAYNFLAGLQKIDQKKIGFRGPSQGGRIALMAASEIPKTSFVISAAAPITTMREGQLYAINQYLRLAGFSEELNAKIVIIWNDYYDQILKGEIKQELVDRIEELRTESPNLYLPPSSIQLPTGIMPLDIEDDVSSYLTKISCPILLTYGENDERVPMLKSIFNAREELRDIDVIIYPRANHSFMQPGYFIASGFLMDQIDWIKSIVKD